MCCAFRMVATTWKYGMFTLPIFMTKKVRLHHMNHCPVVRPREENATTKTSRVKTSQKTSENDWVSHPSMVFLLDSRASFRWSFWHCTIPKFGVFHHTECLGKKGEHITFLFGRYILFHFVQTMVCLVVSSPQGSHAHVWGTEPREAKWIFDDCNIPIDGGFLKWWYPQIINFNRVFHKPSILGYHYFRKHPDGFQSFIQVWKKLCISIILT